jgi:hypothetical protein
VLPVPDVVVDSADFARGGGTWTLGRGWSGTAGGSRARPGEPATASGSAKAEPRHAADGEKVGRRRNRPGPAQMFCRVSVGRKSLLAQKALSAVSV